MPSHSSIFVKFVRRIGQPNSILSPTYPLSTLVYHPICKPLSRTISLHFRERTPRDRVDSSNHLNLFHDECVLDLHNGGGALELPYRNRKHHEFPAGDPWLDGLGMGELGGRPCC